MADQMCAACRTGGEVVIKRALQIYANGTSGARPSIANLAALSNFRVGRDTLDDVDELSESAMPTTRPCDLSKN